MPSPPAAPSDSPLATLLTTLQSIYVNNIFPRLPPALQNVSDSISHLHPILLAPLQSGDIVSLAAFLLAVYLSLRIADYIRRSIFSWIAFLIKIALVLVAIQVVLYAQRYGWQKTAADAAWLWGVVWNGFLEDLFNEVSSSGSSATSAASSGRRGGRGAGGSNSGTRWNLSGGKQQVPVGRGFRGQQQR